METVAGALPSAVIAAIVTALLIVLPRRRMVRARPGQGRPESVAVSGAPHDAGSPIGLFAAVFLAYVLGAWLSWRVFDTATIAAFFPPAGVSVAAMLLTRRRLWPVIVAAIVLGELLIDLRNGFTVPFSADLALANAVEPLVGASLVRAGCHGAPDLRRLRDLMIYVAGAAVAGPLVGGIVGSGTAWRLGGATWMNEILGGFAGDAISVLVVGTPILLWRKQSCIIRSRSLETVAILAATAMLSIVGFGTNIPPGATVLPILALAALRLGMLGTALAGLLVASIGTFLTRSHDGLITDMNTRVSTEVALAQILITALVLTAMIIAQEVARRTCAVQERDVERGERAQVESLAGLARQLSVALTPPDVGRAIEHELLGGLGATSFHLGLLNHDGDRLEWVAAVGGPPLGSAEFATGLSLREPGIATDAARTAKPIKVRSAQEYEQRYGRASESMHVGGARALSAWPLSLGATTVGVLLLGWSDPQPFDDEQLAYLSAVASMVAQPLARAQSYADEHARAVVLHSALHPEGPVNSVGLAYRVHYQPCDEIQGLGGDWYDFLPLPDNRTYLAVGDIVGHGLQAVEDMAQVRNAGRAYAHRGQSPDRLLADLNGFTANIARAEFATMTVAIFDHHTGLLAYCSAGHPPALLRRAATGEVVRLDDANGPLLGPLEDAVFAERVIRVHPGDVLVMYTDGLVENGGTEVTVGIAQLEHLLAELPPERLLDCEGLVERLVSPPRSDDVCLVMARFQDSFSGD